MRNVKFVAVVVLVLLLGLAIHWNSIPPVNAQSAFCDQSVAISVAAAATQTIVGGQTGAMVRVCAFTISADTLATTGQFKSSTTALTGVMRMCDECNISIGTGTGVLFETPIDGNLTITAATGAITGVVRFGRN